MADCETRIALLAGEGDLPTEIAKSLEGEKILQVIYTLGEHQDCSSEHAHTVVKLDSPDLGFLVRDMKARGVNGLIMAGGVPKTLMFKKEKLDDSLVSIIEELRARDDHSLLGAIVALIEQSGVRVIRYDDIIPELMAGEGCIAGREPKDSEKNGLDYGDSVARKLVPLSFGQTVVVNQLAVVAVEAMEGTDKTILRAGSLCSQGVVIKRMRPDQDVRYDLPTVGPETLRNMHEAGLTCLGIEAGRTIILGREEFGRLADQWRIAVWGLATSS